MDPGTEQEAMIRLKVNKAISQGNENHLRDKMTTSTSKLRKSYSEHLNSVRNGLAHLEQAIGEIQEVKDRLVVVENQFSEIPNLLTKLKSIRDESLCYSQLCTAKENFRHIFDVPVNVAITSDYIKEGKLLLAHQHLTELENSRCALLYELHRHPSSNPNDRITLKQYFSDVDKLSEELGKQIGIIVQRTLSCVRTDPTTIVNALRIIEREEKADAQAQKRHDATGFMPQGRPKQWRKRLFDILEETISDRISGNQFEERGENKLWLARHLEVTRLRILDDLRVLKLTGVQCFPPSYNIMNEILKMYHKSLRAHLLDLATHLDGNEYVHLLNWVQAYPGPELLGHPDLNIDLKQEGLDPLLPDSKQQELTNKYFSTIEKNYKEWMSNTINREMKDWTSQDPPEKDHSGHYQTTTPVFIFQMIDQHLQVAKSVNQNLVNRVLALSMNQLATFAQQYKETIDKYARKHFSDRRQIKYFTPYMVAITNNCSSFVEIEKEFRQQYKIASTSGTTMQELDVDSEADKAFDLALHSFEKLRDDSLDYLIHELFLDLDKEISQIGTREWLEGKVSCVENICLTLDDYFQDYRYLKMENKKMFASRKLQNSLAKGYIKAILQKKMALRDYSQREQFCDRFIREGDILKNAMIKLDPKSGADSPFDALRALAEFLRLKGSSLLSLEVQGLKHRYPDINVDHLAALLSMREDMVKINVRRQAMEMLETDDYGSNDGSSRQQDSNTVKTIFSDIVL